MLLAQNIKDKFGTISPPPQLEPFLKQDPTGAGGISLFLSNLIVLIYSLAAIVLIFMILWGAFEWMTSGGDKEKLESARNRIFHALIGIILFAVAFAVIRVLGQFTGFEFFSGQNIPLAPQQRLPPDTPCGREHNTCVKQAGGPDVADPKEYAKCWNNYQACLRENP